MLDRNALDDARARVVSITSLLDRIQTNPFDDDDVPHPQDVTDTVNLVRAQLIKLDADLHRFVTGR